MRFLTADYLFPLHIAPIKEGVLQLSDDGQVITIFNNRSEVPQKKLEVFEGILCPGFVNVHCHLELSHLLGKAEKGKGFLEFAGTIRKRDDFSEFEKQNAIDKAEQEMIANGIVAVGDICNTTDTLLQKQKGNLLYYNFIETFGVHENKIDIILCDTAGRLQNKVNLDGGALALGHPLGATALECALVGRSRAGTGPSPTPRRTDRSRCLARPTPPRP